ncbi:MAG: phosphotransferase [Rhizobiaceae bacterium]
MNSAAREKQIQQFLASHGHRDSRRSHLTGDASTRAYELIKPAGKPSIILMNAPPQPDGPPILNGRSYSAIAHLAEDMRAFVGVAERLKSNGFRVPEIIAHDLENGLLLIENLGEGGIVDAASKPIAERYMAAMETLAQIHNCQWEAQVGLPGGDVHTLPEFDHDAILIEVDLLAKWYAPYRLGKPISNQQMDAFTAIWLDLMPTIAHAEQSILLRDFHSPNIIWMDGAKGTDRTALIDFQDALLGPTAYDVASIAQDARIAIDAELEAALVAQYVQHRHSLDVEAFSQAYAVLATQRVTKVLGIFVRLSQRDHKHVYLDHLPHVEAYLKRSLKHPLLSDYRKWLQEILKF